MIQGDQVQGGMRDRVKQSRDQALPVAGGIADRIAEDVLQDADADGRPCLGKDQGLVGAIGQDAYGSQQLDVQSQESSVPPHASAL